MKGEETGGESWGARPHNFVTEFAAVCCVQGRARQQGSG